MVGKQFSTRPLYLQLRDVLVERIATGIWKPGALIPNESDLAREFGVSSGTMRKALDLVEAERLVTRRQGRGTFVNDPNSEDLANRYARICGSDGNPIVGSSADGEVELAIANETERRRLQLREDDSVWRIRRVRRHGERPFMHEKVSLPAALFANVSDTIASRIVSLAKEHGLLLGAAREQVSIGAACEEAAQALGIATGSPVMVLDRIVHSIDGRPVEWRLAQCELGNNHYFVKMN